MYSRLFDNWIEARFFSPKKEADQREARLVNRFYNKNIISDAEWETKWMQFIADSL